MRVGYCLEPGGIFVGVMNNWRTEGAVGTRKKCNRDSGSSRFDSASDGMLGEMYFNSDLRRFILDAITDYRAAD